MFADLKALGFDALNFKKPSIHGIVAKIVVHFWRRNVI
jgi:hypothetical protein